MQKAEAFEIITEDRVTISATLFRREKKSSNLIIIGPATAAPQRYYRQFAEYASSYDDFDVVTFDYRSIGESATDPVTISRATMSDWGEFDLKAVINWADKKYGKIFLIGHSVTGQIFPKASNHDRLAAAYLVASQSVYFGHWRGISWLKVLIFWLINIPLTTFLFGYMPGWAMGGKVSVPSTVAWEWRKWGLHPQGVLLGKKKTIEQFASVNIPIHFVNIDDDKMLAPARATQALMHCYKSAVTSYQHIKPADLGLSKIGHFGFFKSYGEKRLWSMPMFFFTQFVRSFH